MSKDELNTSEWSISEAVMGEELCVFVDQQRELQVALPKNEELEAALRLMEQQANALTERLTAVTSDAAQERRRLGRDRDETVKHGNDLLVGELAPILDDLVRARAAGQRLGKDAEPLIDGVVLVEDRFITVLRRFGATVFSTLGRRSIHGAQRRSGCALTRTSRVAPW